jgi:hypothetical protein
VVKSPYGPRKDHFLAQLFLRRIYRRPRIRVVLFRRDDSALEHGRLLGNTLFQDRRERIRQTGFTVLHRIACRARVLLSRASFGSALDGTEKITITMGQRNSRFPTADTVVRSLAMPKRAPNA